MKILIDLFSNNWRLVVRYKIALAKWPGVLQVLKCSRNRIIYELA